MAQTTCKRDRDAANDRRECLQTEADAGAKCPTCVHPLVVFDHVAHGEGLGALAALVGADGRVGQLVLLQRHVRHVHSPAILTLELNARHLGHVVPATTWTPMKNNCQLAKTHTQEKQKTVSWQKHTHKKNKKLSTGKHTHTQKKLAKTHTQNQQSPGLAKKGQRMYKVIKTFEK